MIRAYGAAARQVLREAPVVVLIPKSIFLVSVDGKNVGSVYDLAAKFGGCTSGELYGTDGSLTVTVTCDVAVAEDLKQTLRDATRGDVLFPRDDADIGS